MCLGSVVSLVLESLDLTEGPVVALEHLFPILQYCLIVFVAILICSIPSMVAVAETKDTMDQIIEPF